MFPSWLSWEADRSATESDSFSVSLQAVERDGLVRGFEYTKGKYIPLTEEELEALEAEANRSIDLKEFVPVAKIDPVYFESVYYLGPDEGGEKPFRLLTEALARSERAPPRLWPSGLR